MSEVDTFLARVEVCEPVVALQVVGVPSDSAVEGLVEWTERLLRTVSPETTSLVVRVVDHDEMRQINRTYRDQDQATDVLSFPGERIGDEIHLGDIVIALPEAARQAQERGHSVAIEIKTLVLHGVLHCMGYDHETDDGEMEAREKDLSREWIHRRSRADD